MAPSSSRPRTKKGLSRMDAAFDHLGRLGFTKKKITSAINSLLKAYGGDEAWVFLEEECYKLVIETIIDSNEESPLPQLPEPKNTNSEESPILHLPAPPSATPEEQNAKEHQQNGDSDADIKEQGHFIGNGSLAARLAQAGIELMDEAELRVIPPGWSRPPLYGYYSETDSELEI